MIYRIAKRGLRTVIPVANEMHTNLSDMYSTTHKCNHILCDIIDLQCEWAVQVCCHINQRHEINILPAFVLGFPKTPCEV